MSPYKLEVLLHIYYSPSKDDRQADSCYHDAIGELMALSAIEAVPDKPYYRTTELGRAWVNLILETPVPDFAYIDPRDGKVIKCK